MKKKKLLLILSIFLLIVIATLVICYFVFFKTSFMVKTDTLEVNKEYKISKVIQIKNGKFLNKDTKLVFDSIGKKKISFRYQNIFKQKKNYVFYIEVKDTSKPVIECEEKITITEGSKDDILDKIKITDNYDKEIKGKIVGDYDLNKKGEYKLKVEAKDQNGNKVVKEFTLVVSEPKKAFKASSTSSENGAYYVKVNKTLNVAVVYGKDENNKYTKIIKTFVVSTGGENTPNGVFKTTDKVEKLSLVGGVWGHYTIRITGPIWFHSVPYFSQPELGEDGLYHWNNLEYEEYNKLGQTASLGCVRLSTIDAKWLFDNLPWNTAVEIYESETLPEGVVKPNSIKIDVNSENKGWDPTDPDPANPW